MNQIKWHEYTWYSKLSAWIFFVLVLPALTFYVGIEYERTQNFLKEIKEYNETKAMGGVLNASSGTLTKGCYISRLGKDVYVFNILNSQGGLVSGRLSYKNHQKDSSSGAFLGIFRDNILLGDYSFVSEGSSSIRQLIFKKTGNNLVQGFGPTTTAGDREVFVNTNDIVFDTNATYSSSNDTDCQ
jgi:hypothetical protein